MADKKPKKKMFDFEPFNPDGVEEGTGLALLRDAVQDALELELTVTHEESEKLYTYRLVTLHGESRTEQSPKFNKLGTCIPDGGKLWFCMARYAESGITEAVMHGAYERMFLTLLRGMDMEPYASEEEFKRELNFVNAMVEGLKKNFDMLPESMKPDYKEALEAVFKAAEARVNKMNNLL